jgi:hypothetical protein
MARQTKIFGNQRFHYYESDPTKSMAEQTARHIRSNGGNARVVKSPTSSRRERWSIYVRK